MRSAGLDFLQDEEDDFLWGGPALRFFAHYLYVIILDAVRMYSTWPPLIIHFYHRWRNKQFYSLDSLYSTVHSLSASLSS